MLFSKIIILKIVIFFFIALIISLTLNFLLSRLNLSLIQRSERHHIHKEHIPRVGGVLFITTFFILIIINFFFPSKLFIINQINFFFLVFFILFFVIGLLDDFYSINNRFKFILLFLLSISVVWFFDLSIFGLIEFENEVLQKLFIIIFSILCLFFLLISFNLIDGMNGLLLFYTFLCIINYQFISYYFLNYFDPILLFLNISLFTCLIFNFPYAKFFMGDGASYSVAFIVGFYAFHLHSQSTLTVNEWYYACLLSYPVMELLFSFSRRMIDNHNSVFKPDKLHLHTILYQYLQDNFNLSIKLSNPITTIIIISTLIIFNILTIYFLFNNQSFLKYLFFFFCSFYIINYFFLKNYNDR